MPSKSADYEIRIKTTSDLDGAKQTDDELNKLKKTVDSSGTAHEQAAGHVKKHSIDMLGLNHRSHEFKSSLGLLRAEFPMISEAAHALFSPMTAMIVGGTIAIDKLKESIAEMEETFKEFGADGGARGEWAEEQDEAVRKAAVSAMTFAHELAHIANAYQTVAQEAQKAMAAQERHQAAASANLSAQNSSAHSFVNLLEKLHQITPEQGIQIKLRLDEANLQRELQEKLRKIDGEIANRTKTAERLTGEAVDLRDKGTVADQKEITTKQAKVKTDAQIEQTKENLKRDQERAEKIREKLENESPADVEFIRKHLDSKHFVSPNQVRLQRLLQEQRDLEGDEEHPGSGLIAGHKKALEMLRNKSVNVDADAEAASADAKEVREARKKNLEAQKENSEKLKEEKEQREDQAEQNERDLAARRAELRYNAAGEMATARDNLNGKTDLTPEEDARRRWVNNPGNQIPIPTPGAGFPDMSGPASNAVQAAQSYATAIDGAMGRMIEIFQTQMANLEQRINRLR